MCFFVAGGTVAFGFIVMIARIIKASLQNPKPNIVLTIHIHIHNTHTQKYVITFQLKSNYSMKFVFNLL